MKASSRAIFSPMQAIEDFILIKAGIKEAETNNAVKEN